jgi:hypothetical protein
MIMSFICDWLCGWILLRAMLSEPLIKKFAPQYFAAHPGLWLLGLDLEHVEAQKFTFKMGHSELPKDFQQ